MWVITLLLMLAKVSRGQIKRRCSQRMEVSPSFVWMQLLMHVLNPMFKLICVSKRGSRGILHVQDSGFRKCLVNVITFQVYLHIFPDSKIHKANMGPTRVLGLGVIKTFSSGCVYIHLLTIEQEPPGCRLRNDMGQSIRATTHTHTHTHVPCPPVNIISDEHIEVEAKLPPFRRRHFQMHFFYINACLWNLFLMFELTIFQHWLRSWLGAEQATSHYPNQWWLIY